MFADRILGFDTAASGSLQVCLGAEHTSGDTAGNIAVLAHLAPERI